MLLAIDSGNTNVHFAIYEGETRRGEWRTSSNPERTADEYAVWLDQLMRLDHLGRDDVDAAIIANVVPAAAFNLRSLCRASVWALKSRSSGPTRSAPTGWSIRSVRGFPTTRR
jgi:pantothenate kinase type III